MEHIVKILLKEFVTHDSIKLITEKPKGYKFSPGQVTEIAINKEPWKSKKRPLTFCSKPQDEVLEFIIKIYKDHDGVTEEISNLVPGDEIVIGDVWGTISYKGPGIFIAAGSGITPFIAILRSLDKEELSKNKLLFANKTWKDIILEREFKDMLNENARFILSREEKKGYDFGRISQDYLKKYIDNLEQKFYICGPMQFTIEMKKLLDSLGVKPESVVIEN